MGFHNENDMVPMEDIASTMEKLAIALTAYQVHAEQFMATICQLTETNQILSEQIKQISSTNTSLVKQTKEGGMIRKNRNRKMTFA